MEVSFVMNNRFDENEFFPQIDYWKMNWIILVDTSGSMGAHAVDPNSLAVNVKIAIDAMLKEIEIISNEQELLPYIRIITFNDSISYAVGNRSLGEYVTEAMKNWENFDLSPYGGTNFMDAIYEAGESIRCDTNRSFMLPPVLLLITDGMNDFAGRAGNSTNFIKRYRDGHTIRVSIGLRHDYNVESDSFASRGCVEHPDGNAEPDKPFSFFTDSYDKLSDICKLLSRGLISIAQNNGDFTLLDPTDEWEKEDDDWWWE